MGRLDDKVAWVTGAASGIGAASAKVMAAEGAKVLCADRNLEGATAVAKEIEAAGGEAIGVACDVVDPKDNQAAVATALERFGALHVAYLNAGVGSIQSVLRIELDEWERVMAINLRGVLLGIQAAAPAMIDAGGGSIVITSSDAGLVGTKGLGTYCATKHGVIGLMKCAALDLAKHQVRVNAVCPGVIDTPILGPAHKNDAALAGLAPIHPLGRVGRPEEVGRLATFLASEDASFITGMAYSVDGGAMATLGGFDPNATRAPRP